MTSIDRASGLSSDHLATLAAHFLYVSQISLTRPIPQTTHPFYYSPFFHQHRHSNAVFQVQFAGRAEWANWRVKIMCLEVAELSYSLDYLVVMGTGRYQRIVGQRPGASIVADKLAAASELCSSATRSLFSLTRTNFAIERELSRLESEPFLIQPPLTQPIKRRQFCTIINAYEQDTTLAGWHAFLKDRDDLSALQADIKRAQDARDDAEGIMVELLGHLKIPPPAMVSLEALRLAADQKLDDMEGLLSREAGSDVPLIKLPRGKCLARRGKNRSHLKKRVAAGTTK
ncbi:hypothetical protein BV22DRAFT_1041858 [Leucogyrophana mollusca]|uniref:Uncharacterized protein n=1 Tax=Leucogyrophana mollusca TaxID=85980 RepID=A0ACB8AZL2_9AGAM|nr:hypothetical protein BV22DRAFT_1041858 [Leucogyrophana mollusca]